MSQLFVCMRDYFTVKSYWHNLYGITNDRRITHWPENFPCIYTWHKNKKKCIEKFFCLEKRLTFDLLMCSSSPVQKSMSQLQPHFHKLCEISKILEFTENIAKPICIHAVVRNRNTKNLNNNYNWPTRLLSNWDFFFTKAPLYLNN